MAALGANLPEEPLGMKGKIPEIEHLVGGEILHESRPAVGH